MKKPTLRMLTIAVASLFASGAALAQSAPAGAPPAGSGAAATTAPAAPGGAPAGSVMRSGKGDDAANADRAKADKDVPRSARKFVEDAAESGMAEVSAAQVAMQRASQEPVKRYAQMLLEHHQQANAQLKQIATQLNVELPKEPDKGAQRDLKKLEKADGAEFDKLFVDQQVEDHKKSIKLFEKQAKDDKVPQLQQFAQATLPKLQEHLQHAQRLDEQLSASAKTDSRQARGDGQSPTATSRGSSTGAGGVPGSSSGSSPAGGSPTGGSSLKGGS